MSSRQMPGGSAGHVLAVDDNEQNLELIGELLTVAGYRVSLARDGTRALEAVASDPPDCIVLDIMMPGLDGYQVCARLKASPRTRYLPVVMLTALSEVSDKVRGLDAGADDFLNKPVRSEELLARVHSLIRIRRLRDELEIAQRLLLAAVRSLDASNPGAEGHAERVAVAALAAARSLGLPPGQLEAMARGALLHDIGKLGLPERRVETPGPAGPGDEPAWRRHPELGERLLAPMRSLPLALDIVRHHHERLDGSGHPDGLAREAFSVPAELVAIANHFDGLTRRSGATPEEAGARLRGLAALGAYRGEAVEALLGAGVAALAGGAAVVDPWQDLVPEATSAVSARVLVCDDIPANRELLEAMLDEAGFPVLAVESGAAVIPALSETEMGLVLLDIRMPGLSGFEVCEWIKQSPETEFLPVVLVTALSDPLDRARAIQAGADDFVTLPVDRLELLARVRSLLRLRAYYRDLEEHRAVLLSLASAIESRDPSAHGHGRRVGDLAARVAQQLGLPAEVCEQVRIAGQLHNLGKLVAPGDAGDRSAPPAGGSPTSLLFVLPLIRHRHERYDGAGHPDHLKGEAIPLGARILGLANAFDALTSGRSGARGLDGEQALEVLAGEALEGRWDPALYAALAALIRKRSSEGGA